MLRAGVNCLVHETGAPIQMLSPSTGRKMPFVVSEPNAMRSAVPVQDSQKTHRFSRASSELKVLLMEGIHGNAVRVLRDAGF